MMTLLVSQVFIGLSEFKLQYSCSAVTYQMAPTCSKQMNLLHLHRYPINFVFGYYIAAEPDPAGVIGVQIAALKLKQPNLG